MEQPKTYIQTWFNPNYLKLKCEGVVFTTFNHNKVRVDISKDVDVDDSNPSRPLARTAFYSYNANRPGGDNLLRYDSPDPPAAITSSTPYHHYSHHKHDWSSGEEQIILLDDDKWPHVHEFFLEVLTKF